MSSQNRPDRTQTSQDKKTCDEGTACLTVFSSSSVKQLKGSDFALETLEKIALKWDNCMIVLFYAENQESRDMVKIFSVLAQKVAGPVMAACNLIAEAEVARAMMSIKGSGNHPLHWASLKGYPFIMVYRGGLPAAVYNGDRSVSAILDWSMTLACEANYYERYNFASSAQVDNNSAYQMTPVARYPGEAPRTQRTQSSQFTTQDSIRGYNPNTPVTLQGSQEAARESRSQNLQRRTQAVPAAQEAPARQEPVLPNLSLPNEQV